MSAKADEAAEAAEHAADDDWALIAGLTLALVDDAAAFPPASSPVPEAVQAHRGHRLAPYAEIVGPLLAPASMTVELLAATLAGDDLRVGLIADDGLASLVEAIALMVDHEDRTSVAQVEIALPPGHPPATATAVLLDQLAFSATAFVEVPRAGYIEALDVLAQDGAERAKYRTGGTRADAFPSEAELAGFLGACLERGLGFKLTAGLHRALRNTSGEGFEQHGFLNVLAAVNAGLTGAAAADLVALLGQRDLDPLLDVLRGADVAAVRRSFVSFGCCAVADPARDLVSLGLLGEHRR